MNRPYLSVIIPAWNEASRLPLTLIDVDRHLAAQSFASEIIVALSPSSDQSNEILARLALIIKNLKIVSLIENQGKGFALREGMKAARGSYRLTMDADNSIPVIEVLKMLPYLTAQGAERADVVLGSRYIAGGIIEPRPTLITKMRSGLSNFFIKLLLTPNISDSSCAFKCFTAGAADVLFPETQLTGHGIETELVIHARIKQYHLQEVPICWSHDPESRSRSNSRTIAEYSKLLMLRLRSSKQPRK